MRIPMGEAQIGVVTKSAYCKTYYFTADYFEWSFAYQCRVHKPARIMTYAEFKAEFPYEVSKWSRGRVRRQEDKYR